MLAGPARAVLKIDLELRIRDSENPVSERPPMDRFWGVGGAWHAEPRDWSQQARSTGRFCVETALRPAAMPRSQGTSRDRSAGPAGARGQPPCPPPHPAGPEALRSGQDRSVWRSGAQATVGQRRSPPLLRPPGEWPVGPRVPNQARAPPAIPPRETQRAAPKP